MKQKLARRRQFRELNDKTCDFLFFFYFLMGFLFMGFFISPLLKDSKTVKGVEV